MFFPINENKVFSLNGPMMKRICAVNITKPTKAFMVEPKVMGQTLKGGINYLSEKEILSVSEGNLNGRVKR